MEGGEGRGLLALADLATAVWDALRSEATNENFDACRRLIDAQLGAASTPPRTLAQLHVKPCDDEKGFEEHHFVERTADNLSKIGEFEPWLALKFGVDLIMNRDNTVWIPRLMHEKISINTVPQTKTTLMVALFARLSPRWTSIPSGRKD